MPHYDLIDDEALDRIMAGIDITGNYQKIRARLAKKYPKWSQTQRTKFAMGIVDRVAFKDMPVKEQIISKRTTLTGKGFGNKRSEIIRDSKGRYAGKKENLKTYFRAGKLRYKNIKTGKKGIL